MNSEGRSYGYLEYVGKEVTEEEVKKIIQTCFQCGKENRTDDYPYFITELSAESDTSLEGKRKTAR